MTSICFVSPQAYPILAGLDFKSAGGAEVQQVLLAKEMKKNGFDVSFVVADYGQSKTERIDGIKVIKSFELFKGNRALRYLPDMLSMIKAMDLANADIYYQRDATNYTGPVALFRKLKRKSFVYSIGGINNCDLEYIREMNKALRYLYLFGLKNADKIIAQNKYQQESLKKNFNKESIIIKTGHLLPSEKPKKNTPPTVLWVGTVEKQWKQPELFLKLAKTIPSANFQMIGGPTQDKRYYEKISRATTKISNLEFIGFVPYHEIDHYFERASIFVNTSVAEGFPNTFVQAWVRYVPTISLNVDPDEVICEYKLGFHSKTFEQMVSDVKLLLDDDELREKKGMNARKYAEKEHNIKKIVKEYEGVFEELVTRCR